jgi:hypothetical protein
MSIENIATENYDLCIKECDYLEDKTIWIVNLSNSLTVFQDDNRSGKEPVAWKRLSDYCNNENVDIVSMLLRFRSNQKILPEDEDVKGYYFAYGAHKEFDEARTRAHYVCGYASGNNVHCEWYSTPELISTRDVSRRYNQQDIDDKRLILKQAFIND